MPLFEKKYGGNKLAAMDHLDTLAETPIHVKWAHEIFRFGKLFNMIWMFTFGKIDYFDYVFRLLTDIFNALAFIPVLYYPVLSM